MPLLTVLSVPARRPGVAAVDTVAYAQRMGDLPLISLAATLLLANGQTTERTTLEVERLATALGHQLTVVVHWGELILR
ncbi:MAG TPA: hypothetical protein VL614_29180, partial [Acetobacteraceae bacterium]|nr:hypothetical protein [Acetobacteraceae bacterium]